MLPILQTLVFQNDMLHPVFLEDTIVNDRKILNDLHQSRKNIQLNNSVNNVMPNNYMTNEDFWKEADKRIIAICKRYGVL